MIRLRQCLVGWLLLAALLIPSTARAQDERRCFDQPGIVHCISGRFRQFWEQNGGLAVFGYPISAAEEQPNPETSTRRLAQYFERTRFELHPENRPPYDVLLGRMGEERLRARGVDWRGLPRESGAKPGCLWFAETGHNVCDQGNRLGFMAYWQEHGLDNPQLSRYARSLALFGLPLTEARLEQTVDGKQVLTQWFERARFEWHPENPDRYKVLLGLLGNEARPGQAPPAPPAVPSDAILVGAGDVAACDSNGDEATARLLDRIPGTVFVPGDLAYPSGTEAEFRDCYGPSWGRHRHRTRPAPGNHEYRTPGAAPYFNYFGAAAGEPGKGYYSYDLGAWHIVALNSNCDEIGGCGAGSPQERWLRADLAAHPAKCTLAYWHHPRFSSGFYGNDERFRPFWQALYEAGADVVIAGHEHHYERFAPQDPAGTADPQRGIRQFVVGTGGKSLTAFSKIRPQSEVRNADSYGVLLLALHGHSYDWQFIPVEGMTFSDSGSATCH